MRRKLLVVAVVGLVGLAPSPPPELLSEAGVIHGIIHTGMDWVEGLLTVVIAAASVGLGVLAVRWVVGMVGAGLRR